MQLFFLPRLLLENPRFRACTVRERLYLIWLIAQFAKGGLFYRADLEVAITLGVSIALIRRARRLFSGLQWIITKPGFQSGRRNLATRYLGLPCSQLRKNQAVADIHTYAFEALLDVVRQGDLCHADILTYVYLDFVRSRQGRIEEDCFGVAISRLRDLTGLPGVLRSVRRLHRNFSFADGSSLFSYRLRGDRLVVTDWAEFADPADNEDVRHLQEDRERRIAREVTRRKKELRRKEWERKRLLGVGPAGKPGAPKCSRTDVSDRKTKRLGPASDSS